MSEETTKTVEATKPNETATEEATTPSEAAKTEEKEQADPTTSSPATSECEDAKPESEQQESAKEKPESEQIVEEPEPEPIEIPKGQGELVLVTGATGFLASHIVKALLESGEFRVRGSLRSLENEAKVNALKNLVDAPKYDLELVEADLMQAESWIEAVKGCDYVIHTASPFPTTEPDNEDDLIGPAKDGTLAVLKASADSKTVKRVVVTSSIKSISSGLPADKASMNEDVWADLEKPIGAYAKSKTMAEKAAWEFVKELPEDQAFQLAVVNPGFMMGPPLLASAESASIEVVKKLMNREYPALPKLNYPIVDVRDIAQAHIRAMMIKQAAGNRHIVCGPSCWLKDMANILHREFASKGKRFIVAGPNASMQEIAKILSAEFDKQGFNVPTSQAPYVLVWLKSRFDKDLKRILPDVGKVYNYNTKRMHDILQVEPRDYNVTLTEMGHALIDLGIVKKVEEKKSHSKKKKEAKEEGEEKKDEPEKIEDVAAAGDAKVEDVTVTVDETSAKDDDEVKVEAVVAAAEERTADEGKGEIASDEGKEGTSSSTETSPKGKNKKKKDKEMKKKKPSLFSKFSFKKKKPAVEKKEEAGEGEGTGEAGDAAPATDDSTLAATDDSTPAATDDSTPAATEDSTPAATEDSTPGLVQTAPAVFVETAPDVLVQVAPAVFEETAPPAAEDVPAPTEESAPAPTEEPVVVAIATPIATDDLVEDKPVANATVNEDSTPNAEIKDDKPVTTEEKTEKVEGETALTTES